MGRLSLIIAFIVASVSVFGQSAVSYDTSFQYKKVMIIPFEKKMYISHPQSKLASTSNMNTEQIVQTFRMGIAKALQNEILYKYSTTSLIHHVEDSLKDLNRVYGSISKKYEAVPTDTVEEKKVIPVFKGFGRKKKKEPEESGTKIKDGQLVTTRDNTPKFYNIVVKDEKLLPYLTNKYGADLFVFLNEMDIENDLSDPIKLANDNYDRILKFHYTILNHKGELVSKGIISTTFPSKLNDVNTIVKNYFPIIAKSFSAKLPEPKKPKVPKVGTEAHESKTGVLGK